jgi:chromosome segregation ATPase
MYAKSLVIVGILLIVAVTIGAAASSQNTVDPLPALLAEVHALRVAMEQQASVGPRIQLTMARLNIQEQRVSHLGTELGAVRQQLSSTELVIKRSSDALADIERRLQTETDPIKRGGLEAGQRDEQFQVRQLTAQVEQFRARENEASQTLASEQARWIDLNSRLDELERLLTPLP